MSSAVKDAYLKSYVDDLAAQNKDLRMKLELAERENRVLKRSVYDLSIAAGTPVADMAAGPKHLDINAARAEAALALEALKPDPAEVSQTVETASAPLIKTTAGRALDPARFHLKHTLEGHTGAVYTVVFSPCGRFIASGSFDRTVRLWDNSTQKQLASFDKHRLNVVDLSFSHHSETLLSGSFDKTAKLWDIETATVLLSVEVEGLIQCAVQNTTVQPNLIYIGTSKAQVHIFDRRAPPEQAAQNIAVLTHDASVNALHVPSDSSGLFTGDGIGSVKHWDVRNVNFVEVFANETREAITHIHAPYRLGDEEVRQLAVNSYDNVLRVFDQREPSVSGKLLQVNACKGHVVRFHPIKCALFRGWDNTPRRPNTDLLESGDSKPEELVIAASGSANNFVHLWNVTDTGTMDQPLSLEGHEDRVYGVAFHPKEPVLASASGDKTVKLWKLRKTV